jgi:lipid II:glycine glycyltransferase (peptidoglycan interpeptide bridge formation enzyme)
MENNFLLNTEPSRKAPPDALIPEAGELGWLNIDQWQAFVDGHPDSSIFHHRNWLELLREEYGFELHIPAVIESGQVRAAIPFLKTRSLRLKKKLISLPFADYLQILADDQSTLVKLCQWIGEEFRGHADSVVIRGDQPIPGFESASQNVRHEVFTDLPLEQLESRFASAIRRNINKGRREQLEFQKRTDDRAMDEFYRLQVLTRKKLGVPVQSRSYFRRLNDKLIKPGLGFVGIVTRHNVPIAAGVMLGFNGRLTYKYAASEPSALEFRPNDWLVYNSIRIACEEGYRVFDFGISDKNQEGLRRFKSKWGAVETDITHSYLLGQPKTNEQSSRALQLASAIIKRSPTFVCRAVGAALYKYSQ